MTESSPKTIGAVLYADGSAPVNPGPTGYGIHGYTYELSEKAELFERYIPTVTGYLKPLKAVEDQEDAENDILNEEESAEDYVDGQVGNYRPLTASQQFVKPIDLVDIVGSDADPKGTNNRAELMGVLEAIRYLLDVEGLTTALIYCDSQYVIKGITEWCKNWIKNNWVNNYGLPIKNDDLWKSLVESVKQLREKGVALKFEHVYGHTGIKGNEEADQLSRVGSSMGTDGETALKRVILSYKEYKKLVLPRPLLLSHPNLYFENNPEYNAEGTYFVCDPGVKDDQLGKRNPEASYGIVKLTTPDPYLEFLIQAQTLIKADFDHIYMAKFAEIFDKRIYRLIQAFGSHYLNKVPTTGEVMTVAKQCLTHLMTPTGLSFRAIEYFNQLEEILKSFLQADYQTSTPINTHRITDHFYDPVIKKVAGKEVTKFVFKAEHKPAIKFTKITVQETSGDNMVDVELPLVYGLDILPRNTLKRLETQSPNVFIVTWRDTGGSLLKYATVVTSDEGVCVFSNFFSNIIFLKK